MRKLEKSVQYEILNLSLYGQTIENPKKKYYKKFDVFKFEIMLTTLFGYLYIFLTILSPLEIFRNIYRSQEIIFSDLLITRNIF